MQILRILAFLAFLSLPAQARDSGEAVLLQDGQVVYGFYKSALPPGMQLESCEKYAFKGLKFSNLADGKYTTKSGSTFLVENHCLFPATGTSLLKDGRTVYFFSEGPFSENGERVYTHEKGRYSRLKNGEYQLKNGQRFVMSNGYIDDYGLFDGQNIVHENRD